MDSRIKSLQEDIRFTKYRLSFNMSAGTRAALETKLAGLEGELEKAIDVMRRRFLKAA